MKSKISSHLWETDLWATAEKTRSSEVQLSHIRDEREKKTWSTECEGQIPFLRTEPQINILTLQLPVHHWRPPAFTGRSGLCHILWPTSCRLQLHDTQSHTQAECHTSIISFKQLYAGGETFEAEQKQVCRATDDHICDIQLFNNRCKTVFPDILNLPKYAEILK